MWVTKYTLKEDDPRFLDNIEAKLLHYDKMNHKKHLILKVLLFN